MAVNEYRSDQGFMTYLNYKKILELLENEELGSFQIADKTKINRTTTHRIINTLMKKNLIIMSGLRQMGSNGKRIRVYKINSQKLRSP